MPVTTYTLQGDFSALVGEVTSLRATIHANGADQSWINETDLKVVLGSALLPVAADGTFTVTLPTSTGTGLQYEVRAVYVDNGTRMRGSWASGWFDLTANGNLATLANDSSLRVNPSLGEQLAARIDGYLDHGDVSGVLTIDPNIGTHVLEATGDLLLTLDDATDGRVVSIYVLSGADSVTVDGIADLELADGTFATFVRVRGTWVVAAAGSGGGTGTPDTTPPTAVTDLAATGAEGSLAFTWTPATDSESTVKYGYKVWLSTDAEPTTYTIRTAPGPVTIAGLAAGTYNVKLYSFSNGGSTTPDTATAVVTAPLATLLTDTFTRTAGQLINNPTADTGQTWQYGLYGNVITSGGKLSSNTLTTIPIGGAGREFTVEFTHGGSGDLRLSMSHDGTNSSEPTQQIILTGSGIVSAQAISGTATYNISGGTNTYTSTGQFTLSAPHTLRVTKTGSTLSVYVDDVKMLEGTAAAAGGNYFALVGVDGSTFDNVVVKG